MATVYEAVHIQLGVRVAIKILKKELQAHGTLRTRFLNEAKITAQLIHPHIVRVLDFIDNKEGAAIVMEYLEGMNLSEYLRHHQPALQQKIKLFLQTLNAIDFAHRHGIIHRDIKPENIFVQRNNRVKILDFGIAKLTESNLKLTSAGTQMGTPLYMSPEQVKEVSQVDNLTDIYSLGVVFYHLLEGRPPYDTESMSKFEIFSKIVNEPLQKLTRHKEFQPVIDKATRKKPTDRYLTCRDFAADIKKILSGEKQKNKLSQEIYKTVNIPGNSKTGKLYKVNVANKNNKTKKRKARSLALKILLPLLIIGGLVGGTYYYQINQNWTVSIPLDGRQEARAIVDNEDGTFTLVENKWKGKWPVIYLMTIDKDGKILSENRVGRIQAEAKNMIRSGRKYVLAGYKRKDDIGRIWGALVNRRGNILWETDEIWDMNANFWFSLKKNKWSTSYDVVENPFNDKKKYLFAGNSEFNYETSSNYDPDDKKITLSVFAFNSLTKKPYWNFIGYDEDLNEFKFYQGYVGYGITLGNDTESFLVTGSRFRKERSNDVFVIKFDDNGYRLWEKFYGGTGYDKGFRIAPAVDGYIVIGFSKSFKDPDKGDAFVFKIDEGGDVIWSYTFGHEGVDEFLSVKRDFINGGYLLAGYTQDSRQNQDMWFIKINEDGKMLWEKKIGDPGKNELARDIIPLEDNYFMGVGYQVNPQTGKDIYIVKFHAKNNET